MVCFGTLTAGIITACGRPGLTPSTEGPRFAIHSCSRIETGGSGSEDIVVAGDIAFISSDPQRERLRPPPAVFAYDLRTGAYRRAADSTSLGFPFHPHGMGLYQGSDGRQWLFVLNHRTRRSDVVEIFRVNGMRLERVDSVAGPELVRGNDLVPVGPRSFYVSNTLVNNSWWGETWERLRGSRRSSVLLYDSSGFRAATQRLGFANGVNVSRDGRRLYVAAYTGKTLHVFDRADDGSLSPHEPIPLGGSGDNIDVDGRGGVWIVAHRSTPALILYMKGVRNTSPSEVLYFPEKDGRLGVWRRAVIHGPFPQAASVAVRHGDRLLVGSVGDRPADCKISGLDHVTSPDGGAQGSAAPQDRFQFHGVKVAQPNERL